jgi:hypothetical protein
MNRKIIGIAIVLLTVAMLASPVLAIGPQNAIGKNPNLNGPTPYGFDLILDNGVGHGYIIYVYDVPKFDWLYDARDFKINAFVVTDPTQVLEMENHWLYMTHDIYLNLLLNVYHVPAPMANMIASHFPDGVYNKWNYVGQ